MNGVTNYYLSTESYASTMFIYLILAHFGEKGDFKDPKFVRVRNSPHPNLDLIFPVPPSNMESKLINISDDFFTDKENEEDDID